MDAKTGEMGGCPVDRPTTRALAARPHQPRLVAGIAAARHPPPGRRLARPDGRGLRLCRGVQAARLPGAQARPDRADDRQPAVVAGRLRPLRPVLHPHGLARGRHLSHRRRPRRRQQRAAALRPAQQLAGQRQPRQGAAAAVADQAEIRQEHQLGRPVHPRRQRRDRIDGRADLRLRRRPRRTSSSPSATSIGAPRRSGSAKARRRASSPSASWSSSIRWRRSRWA